MTTNDVFLDACKGLVMHCNCNILILNVLGDFRAYIAPEVRLKGEEKDISNKSTGLFTKLRMIPHLMNNN